MTLVNEASAFACMYCQQCSFRALWDPVVGSFVACDMCRRRYFRDGREVPDVEVLSVVAERSEQQVRALCVDNERLKARVDALEEEVKEVKKLLYEVYYAPDMPGARIAARDFKEILVFADKET